MGPKGQQTQRKSRPQLSRRQGSVKPRVVGRAMPRIRESRSPTLKGHELQPQAKIPVVARQRAEGRQD